MSTKISIHKKRRYQNTASFIDSNLYKFYYIDYNIIIIPIDRGPGGKMNRAEILKKLKRYKEKNQFNYNFFKIGIFGSVARNSNHEGSDIDIIVEQKVPDLFVLGTIKTELEEEFGIKIDIIRLHDGISDFFKKRIDQESIYV